MSTDVRKDTLVRTVVIFIAATWAYHSSFE